MHNESKPTRHEVEFMQNLFDRYSEDGGTVDLFGDGQAFLKIVRKHWTPRPTPQPDEGLVRVARRTLKTMKVAKGGTSSLVDVALGEGIETIESLLQALKETSDAK